MNETINYIKEMFPMQPFLNIDQTAAVLGVSDTTIRRFIKSNRKNEIPKFKKIGARVFFSVVDIAKFMD